MPGLGSEADQTVCSKEAWGREGDNGGELSSVSETMFSFVERVLSEIVGLSFQHLGAESTNAVIFTISRENIIHLARIELVPFSV